MTIKLRKFLYKHDACMPGVETVQRMHIFGTKDAYNRAPAEYLVWGVTRSHVMSRRQCVELMVFSLKQVEDRITDDRSLAVLHTAEHWLSGELPEQELPDMRTDAYEAFRTCKEADRFVCESAYHLARALCACTAYSASSSAFNVSLSLCGLLGKEFYEKQAQWIRENIPFKSLNLGVS